MPCLDYYDSHPSDYFKDTAEPALKKQVAFAESALCATIGALIREYQSEYPLETATTMAFDAIYYTQAGITRNELTAWWENHQMLDAKHRAAALKKSALNKLTQDEINALKELGL